MHWIDREFNRQWAVLSCEPISQGDGVYLSRKIAIVCEEFQIDQSRILLVLRDAAKAMKKTIRLLDLDSIDCFIHKIQLVGLHFFGNA